jgi:hypothetical protein
MQARSGGSGDQGRDHSLGGRDPGHDADLAPPECHVLDEQAGHARRSRHREQANRRPRQLCWVRQQHRRRQYDHEPDQHHPRQRGLRPDGPAGRRPAQSGDREAHRGAQPAEDRNHGCTWRADELFTWVYRSGLGRPISRPKPDDLKPPNGDAVSRRCNSWSTPSQLSASRAVPYRSGAERRVDRG